MNEVFNFKNRNVESDYYNTLYKLLFLIQTKLAYFLKLSPNFNEDPLFLKHFSKFYNMLYCLEKEKLTSPLFTYALIDLSSFYNLENSNLASLNNKIFLRTNHDSMNICEKGEYLKNINIFDNVINKMEKNEINQKVENPKKEHLNINNKDIILKMERPLFVAPLKVSKTNSLTSRGHRKKQKRMKTCIINEISNKSLVYYFPVQINSIQLYIKTN